MTIEEFEFLKSAQARAAIERYIDHEPTSLALRLRDEFGAMAAAVATQIKYLGRAKSKIPQLYECRAIIEPLSFEQSSSSALWSLKDYSGELCIDLTCGLGVDVLNFAGRFSRVVAIERNPLLVEIVRYNLSLLGIDNVEVINGDSEQFIVDYGGRVERGEAPVADLIYIDPARRNDKGLKTVSFENCSPNILPLMESIKASTGRFVVKCSPLFEPSELFNIFGRQGVRAEVISSKAECKEVVADCSFGAEFAPSIVVRSTEFGSMEFDLEQSEPTFREFDPPYKYLLLPDVSIYKARMAQRYVESLSGDSFIASQSGYGFSNTLPESLFGRMFEIDSMEPLKPKKIKKELAQRGIKRATIMQHSSSISNQELSKSMGITIGGDALIAVTEINRERYIVFIAKKI